MVIGYEANMMYAKKMSNMDDATLKFIMPDCLISWKKMNNFKFPTLTCSTLSHSQHDDDGDETGS